MSKTVLSQSTMSNLVGMWAIVWKNEEQTAIKNNAFIYGKADEKHFIVQVVSGITGEPNICKLKTIEEMKDWTFVPTVELMNEIREKLERNKEFIYKSSL